jgi:myo-inositol-1(or 4)-monophosphatase
MYADKVVPVLKEAGRELKKYFGRVEAIKNKGHGAANVLTELDLKTERFIRDNLKRIYPSIDFYGEEFGGNDRAERHWLVDPIDGTAHFIRGIPFCTTMIALVESEKVVFAAINDFVNGNTYYAEEGLGAKMDVMTIHVSDRPLPDAYLTYEMNMEKNNNLDLFSSLRKEGLLFKTVSCGYEFMLIASGKIEGRITIDPYGEHYDYAPGSFIVKEAGGIVLNIGQDSYDFKNHNFIAANPRVHEELRKKFKV